MKKYEPGDNVTFYFVIYNSGGTSQIRGWTDVKYLAEVYMEFHKCKYYSIKKVDDIFERVMDIINENANDEINLCNITVRNANHKKGKEETKTLVVPMTDTELTFVNEEINTLLASRINYGFINEALYYLKDKWQKALKDIYLEDVMRKVVYEKYSTFISSIQLDELMVLYRSLPDQFGM